MQKGKLGGARPGAGRPPLPPEERKTRRTVMLSPRLWTVALELGEQSINRGIAKALRKARLLIEQDPEDRAMRQVILYPGEDGYWVIECPSLPGCISQGKTRHEAIARMREAIAVYIETLNERDEPIPEDLVEVIEI